MPVNAHAHRSTEWQFNPRRLYAPHEDVANLHFHKLSRNLMYVLEEYPTNFRHGSRFIECGNVNCEWSGYQRAKTRAAPAREATEWTSESAIAPRNTTDDVRNPQQSCYID